MKKKWYQQIIAHIDRFFRSLHLKGALRSAYEKLAPIGSWRYRLTRGLIHGVRRRLRLSDIHYRQWVTGYDTLDEADLHSYQERLSDLKIKPIISILMPVYNTPLGYLNEAIQSVRGQVYPHWELCIADDASTESGIRALLKSHQDGDARIKVIFREQNGHISAASNSALQLAQGEFVALLDHDDRLHPLALFAVAQAINQQPQVEVIYSDEDKLTPRGKRIDPYFKSDFDYDLLLCQNMVSHLGVYKRATVRQVGGFRLGYEGSQDYDLLLRVLDKIDPGHIIHIPKVLYHWRISKQSVATNIGLKPYALAAGERALRDHLSRRQTQANVESFRKFGYQINFNIDEPLPSVELFLKSRVLNADVIEGLQALFSQTSYEKLTVLLIVGSSKPGELAALRQIKDDRLRITHGVPAMDDVDELNALIEGSSAEIVGLLDEDCLQFSPAWLENQLAVLSQKGVGAVAPKIIYPNGLIFSCGLVLGVDGLARRLFYGASSADPSFYFGWASLHKGYSALSKECILFKRSDFVKVNGLDRDLETQAARMVDFCLKLRHHGLRNVLLPEVLVTIKRTSGLRGGQDREEVVHHPSDRAVLLQKWQNWFEQDPAFNPNLTLHQGKPIVKAPPEKKK